MPLKISPDLDDPTTGKEEEGKEELPSRPDVFGSSPEVPPPKKPKLHGKAFVTEGLEDGSPDGGAPQVTEQIQPQPQTTIINIPPIGHVTDIYDEPDRRHLELSPKIWQDWCLQAVHTLKIQLDRLKGDNVPLVILSDCDNPSGPPDTSTRIKPKVKVKFKKKKEGSQRMKPSEMLKSSFQVGQVAMDETPSTKMTTATQSEELQGRTASSHRSAADDIITLGEQETVDVGGVAVPGRSDQHDREALSCCQGDSESLSLSQSETFQTPSTALQHQPSRWDIPGSGQNSDSQTVLRNSTAAREHRDSDMEVVKVLPSSFDPLPQRGQIRKETQWKSRLPRTDSTTWQTELSDCGKVLPSSKDSCVNEQIGRPQDSTQGLLQNNTSQYLKASGGERAVSGTLDETNPSGTPHDTSDGTPSLPGMVNPPPPSTSSQTSPPLSYSQILKGEVSMQKAVENRERVYGGIGTRKDAQGQGTRGSFAELPQRTLNYDREDDDLFLEEFFSDLEEEEEHNPRKQYVIRFQYKGLDATKLTEQYMIGTMMLQVLHIPKSDILAVLLPLGSRETDLCLVSERAY
ncbi:UNVERIFIED_CONTAM: hypothetical protein K2H54_056762 [Gekko kuhli]